MSTLDRQTFDELLEDYLDGELSSAAVRRIEAFVQADEEARDELRRALMVQQTLRELSPPTCPPDVTRTVVAYARRDVRKGAVAWVRSFLASRWTTLIRPSLAVGALMAALIGGALITRPQPVMQPQQTAEVRDEVESALNDAKWALAYISDIGRRAATSIRDDVLEERLAVPVNRALDAAFEDEPEI